MSETAEYQTNRQVTLCVVLGMFLAAALLAGLLYTWRSNYHENAITRRAKYAACASIEEQTARVVCVNGWGQ